MPSSKEYTDIAGITFGVGKVGVYSRKSGSGSRLEYFKIICLDGAYAKVISHIPGRRAAKVTLIKCPYNACLLQNTQVPLKSFVLINEVHHGL